MTRTAVLYTRVSGEEQAKSGYSLPDQRDALRRWCEAEGYTIIEEVADEGWSGAYLERPGLDRVRDLVAAGGVDAVVVLFRDRLARGVQAGLLADEFKGHGARLIALNSQTDDSPEGDLQGGLLDLFAAYERSVFRRRSQRGLIRSVKQGNVIRTSKSPYGFAFTGDGKSLVIHEPEMLVLRRIFRDTAAGTSAGTLVRELEDEGIPGPRGTSYWNKRTVAYFLHNDLYRPHDAVEVADMVEPEVAASLNPEKVYGLWYWGTRSHRSWKEREGAEYRTRYSAEQRPREEWLRVPVDVTDTGLSAALVDRAREAAKNRYRKPSGAAGRFWQLRGIVRCAECGSIQSPHTVKARRKDGTMRVNFYYQCRRKFNGGHPTCDHTRSYPAAPLEESIWERMQELLSDPKRLLRAYRKEIEGQYEGERGDPDREVRSLTEKLRELERRRSGFIDLAADGTIGREDLRVKLAEADGQRKKLEEALRSVRNVRRTSRACSRM
jgi:site-specific DNA recombinase